MISTCKRYKVNQTEIFLNYHQITQIRGLDHLINLRKLGLGSNQITNYEEIYQIMSLRCINYISVFSKWENCGLQEKQTICLENSLILLQIMHELICGNVYSAEDISLIKFGMYIFN